MRIVTAIFVVPSLVVAPLNEPETNTLFVTLHLKILKLHFYGKDANLMIWAYHVPIFVVVNVGHVIYPIKIFFLYVLKIPKIK